MSTDAKILAAGDAADTQFLETIRTRLAARALVDAPPAVELPHDQFTRLFALAEEGLSRRKEMRAEPPPQIGPKGYVCGAGIDHEAEMWVVRVGFDDEPTARLAAALLFSDVTLEAVIENPAPANAAP